MRPGQPTLLLPAMEQLLLLALQRGDAADIPCWLQTRLDARVAVAGSLDMFSNEFLQATDVTTRKGRRQLALNLLLSST